ncbi:hypothetical protein BOX15_Mlig030107g1 [Macrostomum lignano]|uniref:Uncharacterized protein n=2 Tax=Macrostomum lignano TaxID=282301 RepID=A0A267GLQ5_9PLAT|nr:hypothetical protein BOX15_Mlig030107g2 [Macrostomum lignano]PAA86347.1 hypothetical protein BOX15_Mlig030107g3 [Macrostomum lignano]PAA90692.1 hypothetical protein BOX15_Mlig030107g1 [Macrostomum lignano]
MECSMFCPITLVFLISGSVMVVLGIFTHNWGCENYGSLYSGCNGRWADQNQAGYYASKVMVFIGLACTLLAIVLEMLICCIEACRVSRVFAIIRGIFIILAFVILMSSVLIITHLMGGIYSYLSLAMGTVFILQASSIIFARLTNTIHCGALQEEERPLKK